MPQHPKISWSEHKSKLTPLRQQKMEHVASQRTSFVRLILQDVEKPHNVSACLRSAEAFGISQVDVVSLNEHFKPSAVAKGVDKWLEITNHRSIEACAEKIKAEGYRIVAAMPNPDSLPLPQLSVNKKTAVLLGNEHRGVSPHWEPYVDEYFTIPMVGMVESLNISVCTAISLWDITEKAKKSQGKSYFIPESEQETLLSNWITQHMNVPE